MTEANSGSTINVNRGDVVELRMRDSYGVPGSSTRWDATSSDSSVLSLTRSQHQQPTRIVNSQAAYTADFASITTGTAKIQLLGHNTCEAMNPANCKDSSLAPITVVVS